MYGGHLPASPATHLPADEDVEIPTPLPPLKGSTAGVACGYLHTLALEYGGNVQSWGANQVGFVLPCCYPVAVCCGHAGWEEEGEETC